MNRKVICAGMLVVALALAPRHASAECAWVLWVKDYTHVSRTTPQEVIEPQNAYTPKEECERDRIKATKEKGKAREFYICFPDTIDPRGPRTR